jgi:hypothetical protein
MSKGKVPPKAVANNLALDPIPTELKRLNTLERQLIAPRLPFTKIVSLPKGGQKGVKGPVICVPADIQKTRDALPRAMNDSQIVGVKLKRKLEYRGHVAYKMVNISHVETAFEKLKALRNPVYENVSFNATWADQSESNELDSLVNDDNENNEPFHKKRKTILQSASHASEPDNECAESDEEDNEVDMTHERERTIGFGHDTFLQPLDMNSEVLADLEDHVISVAPGEKQKPVSIFKEDKGEAMSFPAQFPQANNTFDTPRDVKLPRGQYYLVLTQDLLKTLSTYFMHNMQLS